MPLISFILATHNRRAILAHTLDQIARCGIDRADFEIIVVDNGSDDGTREIVRTHADVVIELDQNFGSCAKAFGVERASGTYIVFLDDDSFPRPGAIEQMIRHFEQASRLGAIGFTVYLPDGRREGAALPDVFVGCGVGFRAEALHQAGGLDSTFFMQAEEYDLAFRLAQTGWATKVFDDIAVDHLKSPTARRSDRTTFYDVRNNLRVIARHLPDAAQDVYAEDCLERYAWLADREGHIDAFNRGAEEGKNLAQSERPTYRKYRLSPTVFESFFSWKLIEQRMMELRKSGARRLLFVDVGKNIFAFHRAALMNDLEIAAIGDDRFHAPRRYYRDTPILPVRAALNINADAVVISNTGPVHSAATFERVRAMTTYPIHDWFSRCDSNCSLHLKLDGTPVLSR